MYIKVLRLLYMQIFEVIFLPTKLIGIRLEYEKIKELEKLAEYRGTTANQIAKKAIIEWLEINHNLRKHNWIIIEKIFMKNVLDTIEEDDLLKMSAELAKNFHDFIQFQLAIPKDTKIKVKTEKTKEIKKFFNYLADLLTRKGLYWLDHYDYEIKKNYYTVIKGTHQVNHNFSLMITSIISYLMETYFNYVVIEDKSFVSDTTIQLEYKPKYGGEEED